MSRFLVEEEQVILELFGSEYRLKMLNKLLVRCLHGLRHELTDRMQNEQSADAVEECGVVLEEFCKRILPLLLAENDGKLEFVEEVLETVFTGFLRFQSDFVDLEEKRLKGEDEKIMALIVFRSESANALFETSVSNKSAVSSDGQDLDLYDPVELIMGFVDGIMPALVSYFEQVRRAVQRGERYMGGIGLKSFVRTIISAIQSLYKHLSKKLEVLSLALGMQDVSIASSLIADGSGAYVSYNDEIKLASKLGIKVQSIDIDKQSLSTIILKSMQAIGRFKSLLIELETSVKNSSSDLLTSLYRENGRSIDLLMSKPSLYFSTLQLSRDDNLSAELKSFLMNTVSMSTSSSLSALHSHAHRLAGVSNTMLLTHCISPITMLLDIYHIEGSEMKGVVDKESEDIESFLDRLLPQSTITQVASVHIYYSHQMQNFILILCTQVGESLLSWVQDLETFAGSDALEDLLCLKGEAYPLSTSSAGWKTIATKLELKDVCALLIVKLLLRLTFAFECYYRKRLYSSSQVDTWCRRPCKHMSVK
ncbi:hypothetical protein EON65_03395 [archaeon]|nr:MAG: hypothetical protein EON65_03395 [archaeon]